MKRELSKIEKELFDARVTELLKEDKPLYESMTIAIKEMEDLTREQKFSKAIRNYSDETLLWFHEAALEGRRMLWRAEPLDQEYALERLNAEIKRRDL